MVRLVFDSGDSYEVDRDLTLGRTPGNDIVIADDTLVSGHHADLHPVPGGIEVSDAGSRNGTFINGIRLEGPGILRPGDQLFVGQTVIDVEDVGATQQAPAADPNATAVAPAPPAPIPDPVAAPPPPPARPAMADPFAVRAPAAPPEPDVPAAIVAPVPPPEPEPAGLPEPEPAAASPEPGPQPEPEPVYESPLASVPPAAPAPPVVSPPAAEAPSRPQARGPFDRPRGPFDRPRTPPSRPQEPVADISPAPPAPVFRQPQPEPGIYRPPEPAAPAFREPEPAPEPYRTAEPQPEPEATRFIAPEPEPEPEAPQYIAPEPEPYRPPQPPPAPAFSGPEPVEDSLATRYVTPDPQPYREQEPVFRQAEPPPYQAPDPAPTRYLPPDPQPYDEASATRYVAAQAEPEPYYGAATPHRLLVRTGRDEGREDILADGRDYTIGRDPSVDILLSDPRISARHARVRAEGDFIHVTDLGSANGTLVNGQPVSGVWRAEDGAEIQVGETVLVFTSRSASAFAGTPTPTIVGGVAVGGPSAASVEQAVEAAVQRRTRRSRRGVLLGAAGVIVVAAAAGGLSAAFLGGGDDKKELTTADIVAAWSPATVRIDISADGELIGGGSGSIIDLDKGLVVTNNHVASQGSLQVTNDAIGPAIDAEIVGAAPCDDLAVIQMKETGVDGLKEVDLGDADSLKQGQPVVTLGYPGAAEQFENRALSTTTGVISKVKTVFDLEGSGVPLLQDVIQTDAAINPGNSGGPMFDLTGKQIGVNVAGLSGAERIENENYAISIGRIREILDDLKDGKSPKWVGAFMEDVTANDGSPFLLFAGIAPGGPAEKAGIHAGDLLDTVDGEEVRTLHKYCDVMPDEGTVTLRVVDGNSNRARDVKVEVR